MHLQLIRDLRRDELVHLDELALHRLMDLQNGMDLMHLLILVHLYLDVMDHQGVK
jgi:hypothetical protein